MNKTAVKAWERAIRKALIQKGFTKQAAKTTASTTVRRSRARGGK